MFKAEVHSSIREVEHRIYITVNGSEQWSDLGCESFINQKFEQVSCEVLALFIRLYLICSYRVLIYCTIIKVANKQTKKRLIHSNLETGYFLGFDAECRLIVFVRVDTNHNGFTVIHS